MSLPATFNPALLTQVDQVRLAVGDVNGQPKWFLYDATIQALINAYPENLSEVKAQCCEAIGAQCSQLPEQEVEGVLKRVYGGRYKSFTDLAKAYRDQALPDPTAPQQTGAAVSQLGGANPFCNGPDPNYNPNTGLLWIPQTWGCGPYGPRGW